MTSFTTSACILILLVNIITCGVEVKYDILQNQDIDDFHLGFFFNQTNLDDMSILPFEEYTNYESLNGYGDTYTVQLSIETLSGTMTEESDGACLFTRKNNDEIKDLVMSEEAATPDKAAEQINAVPDDRDYMIIEHSMIVEEGKVEFTVTRLNEQAEGDMKGFECVSVAIANGRRLLVI